MNPIDNQATAIRNLQRYLRRLSYEEDNDIAPIPIDGIFGARTEEALLAFQRAFSLPETGRADRRSWELLFAEYLRLSEKDRVDRFDLFPSTPENYTTTPGEEGGFILLLQWLLSELSILYDSLPPLTKSGRFDAATSDAVREFQRIHSLPVTGLVDRRTWQSIAGAHARLGV